GKWVGAGETLFTLYSPELYAAQQEYLLALQSNNTTLQTAIAKRLRLWGIPDTQIEQIANQKKSFEYMPILSPASGFIVEKNVIEGDMVEAGQKLFRIAGLDKVWIEAEIYQFDLPQIRLGDLATITLPYIPGKTFEGEVSYIYPYLSGDARTGKIRIELNNSPLELLPGMYANVELSVNLGEKLQVPESAVIYTGKRRIVFLDLGEGRLRPQEIVIGLRNQEYFEVISGLSAGDRVVTSGNFLIASESQIRSALNYWGNDDSK
nr:efflux RND transporter periplasmic adaptor subunit [Parachlamydiaceae bacterium]